MKAEIRHLEANSDLQTLRARHSDVSKMLEEKRLEAVQISNEFKEGAKKGRHMINKAKQVSLAVKEKEGGAEALDSVNEPGYTEDQLNADIDSKKAELEFTHGGNENMIQEFEQRERQIDKLQSKLGDLNKTLSDYSEAINEVRQKWEPMLDALISKISHAFSDSFARIGCAGQVSLDKVKSEAGPNNDPPAEYEYDQWAIEIHVKFRESEELALLNAHRQSGGERAVSTIFYLMALQSLSASPFRVVDEINQGMDPRNERMVHGRLVDIACASSNEESNSIGGGGGGQYFLITPKLLSGLSYKSGMRVLCIYSGQHMPKEYAKLDFGRAIQKMKEITAQSGRSTGNDQAEAIANHHQVDVYA
jgi:chromosome segregation ATPase